VSIKSQFLIVADSSSGPFDAAVHISLVLAPAKITTAMEPKASARWLFCLMSTALSLFWLDKHGD
jgi:hypothetical protein